MERRERVGVRGQERDSYLLGSGIRMFFTSLIIHTTNFKEKLGVSDLGVYKLPVKVKE